MPLVASVALAIVSCGGTHGRIAGVWVYVPQSRLYELIMVDSILPITPSKDTVYSGSAIYINLDVSSVSDNTDTLWIHISVDFVENGARGCNLSLIGYKPKGQERYCIGDGCSREQDRSAQKLFESFVLRHVRRYVKMGELTS